MFVKVGNRYINFDNITFIEDQDDGARYAVHFANAEHQTLTFNSGVLGDTSYADLRRFLAAQQAQAGISGAGQTLPGVLPGEQTFPSQE